MNNIHFICQSRNTFTSSLTAGIHQRTNDRNTKRSPIKKNISQKSFCFSRVGRCWEAAGVRKSVRRRKSETTGRRSPPFLHLFSTLNWSSKRWKTQIQMRTGKNIKEENLRKYRNIGNAHLKSWNTLIHSEEKWGKSRGKGRQQGDALTLEQIYEKT